MQTIYKLEDLFNFVSGTKFNLKTDDTAILEVRNVGTGTDTTKGIYSLWLDKFVNLTDEWFKKEYELYIEDEYKLEVRPVENDFYIFVNRRIKYDLKFINQDNAEAVKEIMLKDYTERKAKAQREVIK